MGKIGLELVELSSNLAFFCINLLEFWPNFGPKLFLCKLKGKLKSKHKGKHKSRNEQWQLKAQVQFSGKRAALFCCFRFDVESSTKKKEQFSPNADRFPRAKHN